MAQYKFDSVRWLRNVAEVQSHRAGAGPAMLRENMLKCAEEIDALRARVARLEEVLKQIADGYIRKPICPRMDGTIECGNHLMNRAMMMGLASSTLRGEE